MSSSPPKLLGVPVIEHTDGETRASWDDGAVVATLRSLTIDHDDVRAELTVTTSVPPEGTLVWGKVNLGSVPSRSAVVKTLEERFPGFDWQGALMQVAYAAVLRLRKGEPAQDLDTVSPRPSRWVLYPYVESGGPTIMYAAGASGKSILALAMAVTMTTGQPLVGRPYTTCNVLYLDWETDAETHAERLAALRAGHNLKPGPGKIFYKRMSAPLPDSVEQVRTEVQEHKTLVTVVDSVSFSAGGDLNEAHCATRFYGAMRQVRTNWLLVSHTRKDSTGSDSPDSLFGSVFWFNSARLVWQVESTREPGEPLIHLHLVQRKANNTDFAKPHGFYLHFESSNGLLRKLQLMPEDAAWKPYQSGSSGSSKKGR